MLHFKVLLKCQLLSIHLKFCFIVKLLAPYMLKSVAGAKN